MPDKSPTDKPLFHTQSAEDVLKALEVDPESGTSEGQIAASARRSSADPRPLAGDRGWTIAIAACVLGALTLALQWAAQEKAVTVSFLTLGFTKVDSACSCLIRLHRHPEQDWMQQYKHDIGDNPNSDQ